MTSVSPSRRRRSLVPWKITSVTRHPMGHPLHVVPRRAGGMVEQSPYGIRSCGKGVVVTPLSANVRAYHGNVEWFSCVDEIPEADRQRMIDLAQRELGRSMPGGRP